MEIFIVIDWGGKILLVVVKRITFTVPLRRKTAPLNIHSVEPNRGKDTTYLKIVASKGTS
jgi:hypothetical protein